MSTVAASASSSTKGGTSSGRAPRRVGPALGRYVPLIILGLLFISPLVFMLVTSFKTRQESAAVPPTWIPQDPTVQAYDSVLNASGTPVLRWFVNSMVAASANSLLVVLTAALAAYPLARMQFRGKRIVF